MNKVGFWGTTILIALAAIASTMYVVDQRQFGLLYQLGEIKEVVLEPGLHFKLPPPVQNVRYLDKRLLTLESRDNDPLLTAEKQRMVIDWYVRWRVDEPATYIRNVGITESAGADQLSRVVRDAFQAEINRRTVGELIAAQRETLMSDVKNEVIKAVKDGKPWGIGIEDVRITRADYVASITESVYGRMQAERQRVASELRSSGGAEAEQIRADADRQREVIVAGAGREALTIRGEGDAEATKIYADAFAQQEDFAMFTRSLDAYRNSVGKDGDLMVIDPAAIDFFETMRKAPAGH